jgi:hypothetical protein
MTCRRSFVPLLGVFDNNNGNNNNATKLLECMQGMNGFNHESVPSNLANCLLLTLQVTAWSGINFENLMALWNRISPRYV